MLEEGEDIVTDNDLGALVGASQREPEREREREQTYTLLAVENFLSRDHCESGWSVDGV